MIGVVVADSRWSCNDGGESHGGLDMLIDGDGLFQITRLQMLWTMVEQVEHIVAISYKNITTSYELLPHLHTIAINAIATEIFHYTCA